MIVIGFQNDDICLACNPADVQNCVEPVELEGSDRTLLATVIPGRPLARWKSGRDTLVVSLWKPSEGDWTTEFYAAKVMKGVCDRIREDMRAYFLDFTEWRTLTMLEQFVVADAAT
jgi:hypothetical protein